MSFRAILPNYSECKLTLKEIFESITPDAEESVILEKKEELLKCFVL